MTLMNRLGVAKNHYQGEDKRVLCVCSAGVLRSPTAARVLCDNFGYNTRAAGVTVDFALIPVDSVLIAWADEVICMEEWQMNSINNDYTLNDTLIFSLGIPDNFEYNDPDLVAMIQKRYNEIVLGEDDE